MKPVLYVDIYFFINFSMNWVCLYFTGKVLTVKLKFWRILLSSILGALGAVGLLFVEQRFLVMALHCILCLLMCLLGAKQRSFMGYIRFSGIFWVLALLIGGGIQGLMNISGEAGETIQSVVLYGAILFLILYAVWNISAGWIKKKLNSKTTDVEIYYKGERLLMSGLVDSGNLLREPLTGYPVILVKSQSLETILTDEMVSTLKSGVVEGSAKVLAIPVHSGGVRRMLFGFIPDALFISGGKNGRAQESAVVAMDDLGDSFAGCQCLVPLTLL